MPQRLDVIGATVQLDARDLFCPEPVMLLHRAFRNMATGETLRIVATDPSTQRDIPNFCTHLNHQLLENKEHNGEYRYLLQKG